MHGVQAGTTRGQTWCVWGLARHVPRQTPYDPDQVGPSLSPMGSHQLGRYSRPVTADAAPAAETSGPPCPSCARRASRSGRSPRPTSARAAVLAGWDEEAFARWLTWAVAAPAALADLLQPPYGERAIVVAATGELIGLTGLVPSHGPFAQLEGAPPGGAWRRSSGSTGRSRRPSRARLCDGGRRRARRALFAMLNAKRLVATTEHANVASQAVMRRLGMTPAHEPPRGAGLAAGHRRARRSAARPTVSAAEVTAGVDARRSGRRAGLAGQRLVLAPSPPHGVDGEVPAVARLTLDDGRRQPAYDSSESSSRRRARTCATIAASASAMPLRTAGSPISPSRRPSAGRSECARRPPRRCPRRCSRARCAASRGVRAARRSGGPER